MSSPLWLITGASSGIGLSLCLRALSAGHRVVGSVRNRETASAAVEKLEKAGGIIVEMDMTESQTSIADKVQSVVKSMGPIDYLVNNAGYSWLGACEHLSEKDASLQMATNLFGPLFTLQAVLPSMRAKASGTIVNITSVAAQNPNPACSIYSASKAALEALSESLAKEVAQHGIRVLIVEPGAFRTNFLQAVNKKDTETVVIPPHYADTVGAAMSLFAAADGKQIGDPEKAAERIFEAVTRQGMVGGLDVQRLVLGTDSWERMRKTGIKFLEELEIQKESAASTAFTAQ